MPPDAKHEANQTKGTQRTTLENGDASCVGEKRFLSFGKTQTIRMNSKPVGTPEDGKEEGGRLGMIPSVPRILCQRTLCKSPLPQHAQLLDAELPIAGDARPDASEPFDFPFPSTDATPSSS